MGGGRSSTARQRVLAAAEGLFGERGYRGVTLGDVAEELGMRKPSLYHHAPGGKEQLYVEVMEELLERYRAEMEEALARAGPGIREQLKAAARSILSQRPPVSLEGMVLRDMPAISEERSRRLMDVAYRSLHGPLLAALAAARNRGEIRLQDPPLISGTILSLVGGAQVSAYAGGHDDRVDEGEVADALVDVLLDGLRPREGGGS
jgi:AcrR family transcriptional regulator